MVVIFVYLPSLRNNDTVSMPIKSRQKMEDQEDDKLFSKAKWRIKGIRRFGAGYLGQCFSSF